MNEKVQGVLVAYPRELRFRFLPKQELAIDLSLHNPDKSRIAFQIKSNNARRYSIQPQAAFIDPGQTLTVDIRMHACRELPDDINKCEDKFMIMSTVTGDLEKQNISELFLEDHSKVVVTKLGVILEDEYTETEQGGNDEDCKTTQQGDEGDNDNCLPSDEKTTRILEKKEKLLQNYPKKSTSQVSSEILPENKKAFQEKSQQIKNIQKIAKSILPSSQKEAVSSEFVEIPINVQESEEQNSLSANKNRFQSQDSAFEQNSKSENIQQKGILEIDSSRNFKESIKLGSARVLKWAKKDHIEGRVFLVMFLDLLFPKVIRSYAVQICQIFLGIVVFAFALFYFIWLNVEFGKCKQYSLETAGRPDNAVKCEERLLEKQVLLGMNTEGNWSTEPSYKVRNAGPWQFEFDAYKADEEVFKANIQSLIEKQHAFMETLQNKTFIEILGELVFFEERELGVNGTVELTAVIDLQMVFDNYKYNKFSYINLEKALMENIDQNLSVRITADQQLPPPTCLSNCRGELFNNGGQFYCQTLATKGKFSVNSNMFYTSPSVTYSDVFKNMYFFNETLYSKWARLVLNAPSLNGNNLQDVFAYPDKPFTSRFDLKEVFIFDYCNNVGKDYCQQLLQQYLNGDDKDDFFYTVIAGFWGEMSAKKPTLSDINTRYGTKTKEEVYIDALDMFAIYVGKKEVLPKDGGPNIEYSLVLVPQITQFDMEDGEMVCRTCSDDIQLQNTTNCQNQIYILLHLYSFPVSLYQELDRTLLTKEYIIQNYYVTTFMHGLLTWRRNQFQDYQENNFFYNQHFAKVNDLHCNVSQWTIKNDVVFDVPFLLDTGIYSCLVEDCPGILGPLGEAWANVEFAYLIIILMLSAFILFIVFCAQNMQNNQEKEEEESSPKTFIEKIGDIMESLRETISTFLEQLFSR